MKQTIKSTLAALGVVAITAVATEHPGSGGGQRGPIRPDVRTVHLNHEGCEFTAKLDRTAWELQPYLRNSYRRTPAPAEGDLQLHFLVQRGGRPTWDDTCTSKRLDEETTPSGWRIVYRLATCPRRAAAIPEPPTHPVRLYADFAARLHFSVALGAPSADLVLAHQRELSEIARSVRVVDCVGLGG